MTTSHHTLLSIITTLISLLTMQRFTLTVLLTCFLPGLLFSQTSSVKGSLKDSTVKDIPANAVIMLLRQADSTLVSYSRSDKKGDFELTNIDSGSYTILVTYPKYGDFVDQLHLKEGEHLDLAPFFLTQKAKLLEEIVIKQAAVRMKGDTTEYNADSYEVKPNASVEDLLKELPGIQVDKDGKITAQGQQVQKVLVDGDEFFSDDPTVATKNLRADAVSKVQVFDKKSDQAEFTGIDDGNTTKTINLKMKDNAKHGFFGKLSAGALDKYYTSQGMINMFKNKRKLSAFFNASNTKTNGIGWQDAQNYGFNGNTSVEMMDGGIAIMTSFSSDDGLGSGNYYGEGLPESMKGGIHFSNKWDEDKYNMGGNYLFNKLNVRTAGNTYTQNTILDSVFYQRTSSDGHSDKLQHSLAGTADIQLDSSSSVRINARGFTGTSSNINKYQSQSLSEENQLVNKSDRTTTSEGDNGAFNANALWRKKFKKKGRTLSVNFEEKYSASNSNGFLRNVADFYDTDGTLLSTDTTDQNKVNKTASNIAGVRGTYTEPLSKKSFIEFNYSFYNNNSTQKRLSYDKDPGGKYNELVDSLSNEYKYVYNTHSTGLNYSFNGKKITFSFGGNVSRTAFQQSDLVKDTSRNYHYFNFAPRANFRYKMGSTKGLQINYSGSTQQPSIDQLQPLKNNNDPLNVVIGNPALKQSFRHYVGLNYNSFKALSEQYLFGGLYFTLTDNAISSTYTIDTLGKRTTQYINVDGNYNGGLYGNFFSKIGKTKLNGSIGPNVNLSHTVNFVNGIKNISKSLTLSTNFSLRYSKQEKGSLSASFTPSYSQSKSSISSVAGTNYWTFDYSFEGSIYPVKKLEIGSDIDFNFRQKINAFDKNNDVILWNAFIEKKFMKNEALTLRASINDILNQNKGYDRSIQPNAVVERHYLTFQRYGLITLTWNFNNKGGAAAPKSIF